MNESKREKIIEVSGYGLCAFSAVEFARFLASKRMKPRNVLKHFDRSKELLLDSLRQGAWLPIGRISSVEYAVALCAEAFGADWKETFAEGEFNLKIGLDGAMWVCSIDVVNSWDQNYEHFTSSDSISYRTLDGEVCYSAFKFSVPPGLYSVTVKGFSRGVDQATDGGLGFCFILRDIPQFFQTKNPLEYKWDVADRT